MNKNFSKIGFVGAGKMAQAIINGILKSEFFSPENVFASEPNSEAALKVQKEFGIKVFGDNKELVQNVDVVVLAVKPFIVGDVIENIKDFIGSDKMIISIAAGISSDYICENIGKNIPVIRVMPNTPALVNEGMTAICKGRYAKDEHIDFAQQLFNCLGKVIRVQESQIDIITAISGSSPAFYYYFIDEIAKSAQQMGFDYDTALLAAAQSALGSAKMILETGLSPSVLIDNVTTKGGTTEAGMKVLRSEQTEKIINETIKATAEKSAQLGK